MALHPARPILPGAYTCHFDPERGPVADLLCSAPTIPVHPPPLLPGLGVSVPTLNQLTPDVWAPAWSQDWPWLSLGPPALGDEGWRGIVPWLASRSAPPHGGGEDTGVRLCQQPVAPDPALGP